jgi:3,4-dihydroxy 2-butanone 4-phosphate synthase/GTP cyclohydrolase II
MHLFATVEDAIEDMRAGRMVVVVDDEDRENEGDLTIAAEFATPEAINFMARFGRGLICLALSPERCDALGLDLMTERNGSQYGTAFTVSIAAREGITTGISAADRSRTVQVAIDPDCDAYDVVQPGHMFPLKARPGGVLERAGQTEAAVDLARLAGLQPGGVICEIMNDDGTMARVPDLVGFCREHGLKMITVQSLIAYRRQRDNLVERVVDTVMPTSYGPFTAVGFREHATGLEHMAMVKGDVVGKADVLVRVHLSCTSGDVLGSRRCGCAAKLDESLRRVQLEEHGAVVYLARDDGLRCPEEELGELSEPPLHLRRYGVGAQILAELGLSSMRLLTAHELHVHALEGHGLRITESVTLSAAAGVSVR